jgi:hypothetical protein
MSSVPPPGFTADDMVAELRFVMNRYPAMRTRLRFEADGTTKQVIDAEGEIDIEVVDVEENEDPQEIANAIRGRYTRTVFDYANEWPVRVALVRKEGVLRYVVRAFCHLASDGMGFARMVADVFHPARSALPAPAAEDALDQARWQATAAGVQQSENALRYWESQLRAIPANRFTRPSGRGGVRGKWQVEFVSAAMERAMRVVAARTGVPSSAVLLTAFAVSLSRVAGADPVVTKVLVSNRFRPRLTDTVSPVAQHGLLVVGGLDRAASFDEAIARTQRAAMGTYKHAYYDPQRLRELVARVGRERGEQVDLACLFNDRRIKVRDKDGPAPTEAEIRAALRETELRWAFPTPNLNERLLVVVNDIPATIAITVMVDTDHLAPDGTEALLRGMEETIVGAAIGCSAEAAAG